MNAHITRYAASEMLSKLESSASGIYDAESKIALMRDYATAYGFASVSPHIELVPLIAHVGGTSAHATLMLDSRLPSKDAFFGFFEAPDSEDAFGTLFSGLREAARERNVTRLLGPVSGSIWHTYRVVSESDGTPRFTGEPISAPYYSARYAEQQPSAVIGYHSGYRERFEAILEAGKAAYAKLGASGFRIERVGAVPERMIADIGALSSEVFRGSWGYTDIGPDAFSRLYAPDTLARILDGLFVLYRGDALIGYCSVFHGGTGELILKTIAVLPAYQGVGLGNALAYAIHEHAAQRGVQRLIYALVRDDNRIKDFPKRDAVVFRRYLAYEFRV